MAPSRRPGSSAAPGSKRLRRGAKGSESVPGSRSAWGASSPKAPADAPRGVGKSLENPRKQLENAKRLTRHQKLHPSAYWAGLHRDHPAKPREPARLPLLSAPGRGGEGSSWPGSSPGGGRRRRQGLHRSLSCRTAHGTFPAARRGESEAPYLGCVNWHVAPTRDPRSRHYVPAQLYLDISFPPYGSGCTYAVSTPAASTMLAATRHLPLVPVEDAFVGLCARRAGITPCHLARLASSDRFPPDACCYQEVLFSAHVTAAQMLAVAATPEPSCTT
ncbi:beta-C3-galactosyltransferase 4-like [Crotalus adamanteus]|uniref:Hexosyltransferase n=1 Tax=Crotalus adamanteus TaxID=8729 RepID=A0AAW1BSG2_CROAD